ncbi:MAG: ribosome-binding factor [Thermoleophilia bacterium]|nr:ribosome-binding factor [Thermoleophilia bacterium]MCZ4495565.1 ribosome-binding factor [Thermoleophilia bacterium]
MSDRKLRINERMRQVLGEAVGRLEDPRLGFITITGVVIANDFHNAKVYVSVLGDEEDRERSLAGLRSAHGLLQRAVGKDTKLHHTPKLEFIYDDTTDSAMRLESILRHGEHQPGEIE